MTSFDIRLISRMTMNYLDGAVTLRVDAFLASNPGPHHFDPSARPSSRVRIAKVEHSDRSDEGLGSRLTRSELAIVECFRLESSVHEGGVVYRGTQHPLLCM